MKDGRYIRRHRFMGAFEQQFLIGRGYDLADVRARIANGVLTKAVLPPVPALSSLRISNSWSRPPGRRIRR